MVQREKESVMLAEFAGCRGFTILEVMAVLVILGLIIGLVSQAVIPRVEEAKIRTARTQMEILGLALDNYRLDVGAYPDSLQELVESSVDGWRGPYLKKGRVPVDPWKDPYLYEVIEDGEDYRISSKGGGKETINNWE